MDTLRGKKLFLTVNTLFKNNEINDALYTYLLPYYKRGLDAVIVQDFGVIDIANMGAAMAPAACDTLCNFFYDTNTKPDDYDLIATGDLGKLGSDILRDLMQKKGFELRENYADCGHTIYSFNEESYQGGSGAGCSALVLATYILDKMKDKTFSKVLVVATGALMSTITNQQGDSIPCVSHLIEIVRV